MNDRIKELEIKCWIKRDDSALFAGQTYFDAKKFAELIVKECCSVLENSHHEMISRYSASDFLKKHFGVEE